MVELAEHIIEVMRAKGYRVYEGPHVFNIVYVSGMNIDGTANFNRPDFFNDLRCIIRVLPSNKIEMLGIWQATTEPGRKYVDNRINPKGAAFIEPGQYAAWQVGMHKGHHEALVQTGGKIKVRRDDNEDFKREGDELDYGYFGINQHGPSGHNEIVPKVGPFSAGCLVARSMPEHRTFMAMVKTDSRFEENSRYIFTTTVLMAKDLQEPLTA